jgi:asparagine synthase (glutamine-hydrolysing)
MCGVAGVFWFKSQSVQRIVVSKMTDAMQHRGPDADGFYVSGSVGLGHRRLSIIDLSDSANCPFTDASGRFVLVFNGELYNFQEVKRTLNDYPFKTSGDTEVLAAAFARWGADCVTRFKGMFAFAVWDKHKEELTICRDRMGVKPLYYFLSKDKIVFASEIRAILASGLVPAKLDPHALLDYFAYQSVGFPSSPIKDIKQVEAGSYLTVSKDKIIKKSYWRLGEATQGLDFSDKLVVQKKVRQLLVEAVERRLISDVPVGAFLSGGIDSSTVVGLMAEVSSSAPVTFNISFAEKEFDESSYAEMIARKFNTRHSRIQLRPEDFLEEVDHALAAMDTPSADGVNTYVVSKAIRKEGITVALSGVGGDELFAGYPFFRRYQDLQRNQKLFSRTSMFRRFAAKILRSTRSGKNHRLARILSVPDLSITSLYPEFRRILTPEQLGELTQLDIRRGTLLEQELTRRDQIIKRLPLLSQVSAAEYLGYTQHTLLKDTDQMSMAVSLEVREPFFDHDLVEYILQVPDVIKNPVFPKSLLVESVSPLLPDEVVHRKKQGFLFPWELWMKRELKSFCELRIARLTERNFIQGPALQRYWNRFLKGDHSVRWTELWLFVVLEYWMEKNNVES